MHRYAKPGLLSAIAAILAALGAAGKTWGP